MRVHMCIDLHKRVRACARDVVMAHVASLRVARASRAVDPHSPREMLAIAGSMGSNLRDTRAQAVGGRMNKGELIDAIADGAGLGKGDAVQSAVAGGDKVTLPGFGSFSQTQRSARTGRNPQTGEPVQIKASKAPKFSAGAKFKELVNK
jgi:DNA-binding protein HU-beta